MATDLITTQRFKEILRALYDASEEVADARQWCHEWYIKFNQLTPHITARYILNAVTDQYVEEITVHVEDDPVDPSWLTPEKQLEYAERKHGEYQAELDRIRGRVLTLVAERTISLDHANNVLVAIGFPRYVSEETAYQYRARLEIYLDFTSSQEPGVAIPAFRAALSKLAGEHGVTNAEDLDNHRLVNITEQRHNHLIRNEDTCPLL